VLGHLPGVCDQRHLAPLQMTDARPHNSVALRSLNRVAQRATERHAQTPVITLFVLLEGASGDAAAVPGATRLSIAKIVL
jgi:hypothetical protein